MMNSDDLRDYTLGVCNGYIELRVGGALAMRRPWLALSGLTIDEALRVLVGRYDGSGGDW